MRRIMLWIIGKITYVDIIWIFILEILIIQGYLNWGIIIRGIIVLLVLSCYRIVFYFHYGIIMWIKENLSLESRRKLSKILKYLPWNWLFFGRRYYNKKRFWLKIWINSNKDIIMKKYWGVDISYQSYNIKNKRIVRIIYYWVIFPMLRLMLLISILRVKIIVWEWEEFIRIRVIGVILSLVLAINNIGIIQIMEKIGHKNYMWIIILGIVYIYVAVWLPFIWSKKKDKKGKKNPAVYYNRLKEFIVLPLIVEMKTIEFTSLTLVLSKKIIPQKEIQKKEIQIQLNMLYTHPMNEYIDIIEIEIFLNKFFWENKNIQWHIYWKELEWKRYKNYNLEWFLFESIKFFIRREVQVQYINEVESFSYINNRMLYKHIKKQEGSWIEEYWKREWERKKEYYKCMRIVERYFEKKYKLKRICHTYDMEKKYVMRMMRVQARENNKVEIPSVIKSNKELKELLVLINRLQKVEIYQHFFYVYKEMKRREWIENGIINKKVGKEERKKVREKEGQEIEWYWDPVEFYMGIKKVAIKYKKEGEIKRDEEWYMRGEDDEDCLEVVKEELPGVIEEMERIEREGKKEYKKEVEEQKGDKYKAIIEIIKRTIGKLESSEKEAYKGMKEFQERYKIKKIKSETDKDIEIYKKSNLKWFETEGIIFVNGQPVRLMMTMEEDKEEEEEENKENKKEG